MQAVNKNLPHKSERVLNSLLKDKVSKQSRQINLCLSRSNNQMRINHKINLQIGVKHQAKSKRLNLKHQTEPNLSHHRIRIKRNKSVIYRLQGVVAE